GAARHRCEGEEVDTAPCELRQNAVGGAQLIANIRVVVVDAPDREGHGRCLRSAAIRRARRAPGDCGDPRDATAWARRAPDARPSRPATVPRKESAHCARIRPQYGAMLP